MKKRPLIFDIDGTLWNACPASAKGWNIGLKKLGENTTITAKQIESVAGNPYEKCIEILLPRVQKKHPELANILNRTEIKEIKKEGGIFYDSVIKGIKKLSESHEIFLVSNCQDWYMEIFLKFSKLKPFITDYDCHGMSNLPKSKMLKNMVKKHSLKKPVYIGDTKGDEESANSAKMEFLHASYGFGKTKNKVKNFNSFTALLDYLEK